MARLIQSQRELPSGVYPLLYAFFNRNGTLDEAAVARQIEVALASGVQGIAILGLATEVNKLLTPEFVNYMRVRIPRERFVTLAEISAMVAWLLSMENSFTTAATFDLSGGLTTYLNDMSESSL